MKFNLAVLLGVSLVVLFCDFNHSVHGHYNILFFTMFGSQSHIQTYTPAIETLNKRGHNVTYLTVLTLTKKVSSNITVHYMASLNRFLKTNRLNVFNVNTNLNDFFVMANHAFMLTIEACKVFLNDSAFRRVAEDRSIRYDVVIMDPIFSECGLVLIHLLDNPPLIYYSTTQLYPWIAFSLGITVPASYVPSVLSFSPDFKMFTNRFVNAVEAYRTNLLRYYRLFPLIENIVRGVYPEVVSLLDIERNVSFVLANTHSASLGIRRPSSQYFAEVGGTHCHPYDKLPKDLEDFIAGAGEDGFIYLSFGTYVFDVEHSLNRMNAFMGAFRRLKQRIIWKLNVNLTDVPSNVKLSPWLPQQDLLGHPMIRVFITQGGQLSSQEAVYHGVPVLGMPIIGDQFSNVKHFHDNGIGETLDYKSFSEQTLYETLLKLMSNSSYKDNCRRHSILFRDRSMSAIDTIVYWVEYVVNHDGAKHLRRNKRYQRPQFVYQYFLMDVVVVNIAIIAFFIFSSSFLRKLIQVHRKRVKPSNAKL